MDLSKSQLQVIFKQLRGFLPEEEEVEYAAVARNANTLYVRPCLLATDWRVILVEPKYLGITSQPRAIAYEQIANIHLEEGWFTSKISITPYPGAGYAMVVDLLEKRRARALYEYVKERTENNEGYQASNTSTAPKADDPLVEKLSRLKQLLDEGLITQEEFDNKKQDLLNDL
ncbi:MAG: PH domain-containing protein [Bacteroidota bacterium]